MTNTVKWTTRRTSYEYYPHPIGTNFKNVPGNYIFAYQSTAGWHAVYIGQTNDLGARLANHEKLPVSMKAGATHILAHTNSVEADRLSEEADLVATFQPRCNDLLK